MFGMLRTRFLFALFLYVAVDGLSHAQCVPEGSLRTETFSTIEEVKGQGPAGSELILDEQGERVIGTLKEYRGSPDAVKTKLTGSIEESESIGTMPARCKVDCREKTVEGR